MSDTSSGWDRRSVLRTSAGLTATGALSGLAASGAARATDGRRPTTGKLPKPPSTKGAADRFTGDVWVDNLVAGKAPSRLRASMVRFAPCSRTAWHRHEHGQTLHVTEGIGLVQARGGKLIVMRALRHHPHPARRVALARSGPRALHDPPGDGRNERRRRRRGRLVTDVEYEGR